jgi:dTDP-4-dehydrorhamnose reductase
VKILITGAGGQLGRALRRRFAEHHLTAPDHRELDVGNREQVMVLRDGGFDLILHAAAMTNVDGCERDPDAAYRTNVAGTENVARLAQATGADMLYVSTDYVYDGRKGSPYREGDETNPLSVYAASKLAGEQTAASLVTRLYVARTAWVFGPGGNNFPRKIVEFSHSRPSLSVVTTESGHPTYAPHLADAIYRLVMTGAYGCYHLVNEGCVSRYDFARAVLDAAGRADFPIEPTDYFPRVATPPGHVELDTNRARRAGAGLPHWRDGLREWVAAEGFGA